MANQHNQAPTCDYLVVGAGSAGCVIAARLSEISELQVTLLEAGGDDRPTRNLSQFKTNMMMRIPAGFNFAILDSRANWKFKTEADPSSGGREHEWPRGKVFGGSSSLNGMIYARGVPTDYERWVAAGAHGWDWQSVLAYFKKSEHAESGADEWHGIGGPLNVCSTLDELPVLKAALHACDEVGMPLVKDARGIEPGASFLRFTVKNGRRCSTAAAFLHPALARPNLRVETQATVHRVLFEGHRAVGVEFQRHGQIERIYARKEVILATGAVASPVILERSGIGAAERLKGLGIEVVSDLPDVGENMQDHYLIPMLFRLKQGTLSLNDLVRGWRFYREVARYLAFGKGLLSTPAVHAFAFAKSDPRLLAPDINFAIMPATPGQKPRDGLPHHAMLESEPGLTIGPMQMRPESRGSVHARSANPDDAPIIRANYLSHETDRNVAIAGIRWGRRIASAPALRAYMDFEIVPGPDCQDDKALLAHAQTVGQTAYHPSCTCAIGKVVGADLKVYGVEGLRVADASVMPYLTSGNTNAPTIMIGEKAADMVKADYRHSR